MMPAGDLKHRAKRANEGLKLGATFLNSVAIVTVAAAFITPVTNRRYNVFDDGGWLLLVIAAASHLAGQNVLRALRAEE